jgi:hypothetical protein
MSKRFSGTPKRKEGSNLGPLNDFFNNLKGHSKMSLTPFLKANGASGINDLPKLSLENYLSIYSSLPANEKKEFKKQYLKAFEDDGVLFQKLPTSSKSKKGGRKLQRRTRKNI